MVNVKNMIKESLKYIIYNQVKNTQYDVCTLFNQNFQRWNIFTIYKTSSSYSKIPVYKTTDLWTISTKIEPQAKNSML